MKPKYLFSIIKHSLSFTSIFAAFLVFTSCNIHNLDILKGEDTVSDGTIQITVGMPGDTPQSRISLEEDEEDSGSVSLAWQDGDQIDLLIVYKEGEEEKQTKQTVTVDIDTQNLKIATFSLKPPKGNYDKFDLYGVYGGGGLSSEEDEEHLVILPTVVQSTSGSLEGIQTKEAVVLTFACPGIKKTDPLVTATFKHLGSLFKISLKNTGTTELTGIIKAELCATEGIAAYVNSGTGRYNLKEGKVTGTTSSTSVLTFNIEETVPLASGETIDFWGWYIPGTGNWPAVNLKLYHSGTPAETTTNFIKVARNSPTKIGKVYHLAATFHDGALHFTTNKFTDTREDEDDVVYKTVTIGGQVWMAENLRYLPSVGGNDTNSFTVPCYYVYDYNGTDIVAAKATDNYKRYGVLYNWPAAMAGEKSSTDNPSGVQGICPTGWHLPSDAEWTQMETYLADNGYNYDGSIGGSGKYGIREKIAKSLAGSASDWEEDAWKQEGSVGNTDFPESRNKSGFTALPGGYYDIFKLFCYIKTCSSWWSSTEETEGFGQIAWYRVIGSEEAYVAAFYYYRSSGFSVRCVRD